MVVSFHIHYQNMYIYVGRCNGCRHHAHIINVSYYELYNDVWVRGPTVYGNKTNSNDEITKGIAI